MVQSLETDPELGLSAQVIASGELVPGDRVLLASGDKVPTGFAPDGCCETFYLLSISRFVPAMFARMRGQTELVS